MGDVNLLKILEPSPEFIMTANSPLHTHRLPISHSQSPVQHLASSSSCLSLNENTSHSSFMDSQATDCVTAHLSLNQHDEDCVTTHLSLNQHALTLKTLASGCDFKPQLLANCNDITRNHNGNTKTIQNTFRAHNGIRYNSSDDLKTLSLCSSLSSSQNLNLHQDFFSSCSSDFLHTSPKPVSFSSDVEMSCSKSLVTTTAGLATQGCHTLPNVTFMHSKGSQQLMSASTAHAATKSETGVCCGVVASARSPLLNPPNQIFSDFDASGNRTFSSSIPSNTAFGGGSVHDSPSNQMKGQQSISQSYASLTPWTSKLTSPGYTPLPKPAQDAMPIPLEHTSQEYILSMSSPSQEVHAMSHHGRPCQMYSHFKPGLTADCYNEAISNSKKVCGNLLSQTPGFKILHNKEHRFRRTADALQKSGLWEVAMKTGSLIKRNRELQKELEEFRYDAIIFLKSVIKNPQNREFIRNVLTTALTSNTSTCTRSSVMSVVVSAAAAAASASVRLDSEGSSDSSTSGNSSA